jgi:hypothetical protein
LLTVNERQTEQALVYLNPTCRMKKIDAAEPAVAGTA